MSQGSLPARADVRAALLSALVISGPGQAFAATVAAPPPSPAASAASSAIDERTRLLAEGPMRRILAAGSAAPSAPVVVRVTPPTNPAAAPRPKPANPIPPVAAAANVPEPAQNADIAPAAIPTPPAANPDPTPVAATAESVVAPSLPPPSATALASEATAPQPTPNAPRLIHTEPIELPESISRRLRGPVDLTAELMISETGQVTWVNLPQVPFPALRAPVAAAIKEWQFAPLPTLTAHRLTVRLTASD